MSASIDQSTLDALAGQMGGTEALGRIIGMYAGKLPGEVEELRSALDADDLETVGSTAHRLKSSSGQLGAKRLAVMLAGLEQAGREGDPEAAGRLFAEVQVEAELVWTELEALKP